MSAVMTEQLPLPLLRSGKVREVYIVDDERLLLVASDRVSAFDVIMRESVPHKGAVLTQMTAWWLRMLGDDVPHHLETASTDEIVDRLPALAPHRAFLGGRSMLCRRTEVFPVECVVRGYLSGSAWKEYQSSGRVCGIPLPAGLRESEMLPDPSSHLRPRRKLVTISTFLSNRWSTSWEWKSPKNCGV
jgi:phosphoribosylaminoimidazole-succinocarboxamide synthase